MFLSEDPKSSKGPLEKASLFLYRRELNIIYLQINPVAKIKNMTNIQLTETDFYCINVAEEVLKFCTVCSLLLVIKRDTML